MFYRTVREPFMMALSKSAQRKYWFNTITKQSVFELPPESVARFSESHRSRIVWYWEGGAGVHQGLSELWNTSKCLSLSENSEWSHSIPVTKSKCADVPKEVFQQIARVHCKIVPRESTTTPIENEC